jgi:hypothetical protein
MKGKARSVEPQTRREFDVEAFLESTAQAKQLVK